MERAGSYDVVRVSGLRRWGLGAGAGAGARGDGGEGGSDAGDEGGTGGDGLRCWWWSVWLDGKRGDVGELREGKRFTFMYPGRKRAGEMSARLRYGDALASLILEIVGLLALLVGARAPVMA